MREKVDQFIALWSDIKTEISRIVRCMTNVRLDPGSRARVNYFEVDDEGISVNVVWDGCLEQFEWHVPRCYFGADALSIEKRETEIKQVEDKRRQELKTRKDAEREYKEKKARRDQYYELREEFDWEEHRGI